MQRDKNDLKKQQYYRKRQETEKVFFKLFEIRDGTFIYQ